MYRPAAVVQISRTGQPVSECIRVGRGFVREAHRYGNDHKAGRLEGIHCPQHMPGMGYQQYSFDAQLLQ